MMNEFEALKEKNKALLKECVKLTYEVADLANENEQLKKTVTNLVLENKLLKVLTHVRR